MGLSCEGRRKQQCRVCKKESGSLEKLEKRLALLTVMSDCDDAHTTIHEKMKMNAQKQAAKREGGETFTECRV